MIEIKLSDSQTGYNVIGNYISRYWEHKGIETIIFSIGLSYDGQNYSFSNEVASPMNGYYVEFLSDWWEGEKYIRLIGIQSIDELAISGGIYEE